MSIEGVWKAVEGFNDKHDDLVPSNPYIFG